MKKIILPIIIVSCMISGCYLSEHTSELKPKISIVDNDGFTSTQRYQILCWTIKKHENYEKNYYKCQAGKNTKGWGFTNVKNVRDIHHADKIFKGIIEDLYNKVNMEYPTLTYLQKAVIVSLYYNTGDVTAIKNSNFIRYLVDNDIEKSINSFQKWNKVKIIIKGKKRYIVSNGLVNRRNYETKLLDGSFNMDDYQNLKKEVEQIYIKSKKV